MYLLEIFAEVLKRKENAKLLLIGDGYLRDKVIDKAKELNVFDKVIMLGNRNDVADLYNVMDVFFLPSHFEGLCLVGIEAQTNGLASYFSDCITREVGVTALAAFLPLGDAKTWADRITGLDVEAKRCARYEDIKAAGFDIRVEAGELGEMYLNFQDKDQVKNRA